MGCVADQQYATLIVRGRRFHFLYWHEDDTSRVALLLNQRCNNAMKLCRQLFEARQMFVARKRWEFRVVRQQKSVNQNRADLEASQGAAGTGSEPAYGIAI